MKTNLKTSSYRNYNAIVKEQLGQCNKTKVRPADQTKKGK
jgi:hypothetical protein